MCCNALCAHYQTPPNDSLKVRGETPSLVCPMLLPFTRLGHCKSPALPSDALQCVAALRHHTRATDTNSCKTASLLQGRCVPSCPENTIGLLLYRLIITNALIINGCDLGRGLVLRYFSEQAYDPPDVRPSARFAVCK